MNFERESSNGWDHRWLQIGKRLLIGWATLVPGEPWEGPWIGARVTKNSIRFGIRGFACGIGIVLPKSKTNG
jgi:hypothetical protein